MPLGYQAEYSRNLLFRIDAQMDQVFDRVVDLTALGSTYAPCSAPCNGPAATAPLIVASTHSRDRDTSFDPTLFKLHFESLTLKAYTKGEHGLRFEAIGHNNRQLRRGRVLDCFPTIIGHSGMVDRFSTTLDCVDVT